MYQSKSTQTQVWRSKPATNDKGEVVGQPVVFALAPGAVVASVPKGIAESAAFRRSVAAGRVVALA